MKLYDLVIIGGGASAALLLLQLENMRGQHIQVAVVNEGFQLMKGAAYSNLDECHLLNVRASKMSALAGRKNDFTEWVRLNKAAETGPYTLFDSLDDAFLPRVWYGQYLEERIKQRFGNSISSIRVSFHQSKAEELKKETLYSIKLSDGSFIKSPQVILATGNEGSAVLPCEVIGLKERIVLNPWRSRESIGSGTDLIIIGTGLTMVDIALSHLSDPEFTGTIHAISRHGRLPLSHPSKAFTVQSEKKFIPPSTLSELFTLIRERMRQHPAPEGWEEPVLDDLRPHTVRLWQQFRQEEKERFIRHLQTWWSILRHRVPYPVHMILNEAICNGRLVIHKGRLKKIIGSDENVSMFYTKRGSNETACIRAGQLICSTGPVLDITRSANPVLKQMAEEGLITSTDIGLGPLANEHYQLIDKHGNANQGLYGIGPLMRGNFWETTAIPEIREAAVKITDSLSRELTQYLEVRKEA
jgi:uncharacterized NAD(P)/FAD-binding protein YdhS